MWEAINTFLASLYVCLMFTAVGVMFWVFWDEDND